MWRMVLALTTDETSLLHAIAMAYGEPAEQLPAAKARELVRREYVERRTARNPYVDAERQQLILASLHEKCEATKEPPCQKPAG
jgi:hypothetical protein